VCGVFLKLIILETYSLLSPKPFGCVGPGQGVFSECDYFLWACP
jgi:hypothetical protein